MEAVDKLQSMIVDCNAKAKFTAQLVDSQCKSSVVQGKGLNEKITTLENLLKSRIKDIQNGVAKDSL